MRKDPAHAGWTVALVDVDPVLFDDSDARFNITMPRRIARRLDDLAKAAGETRSAFIAKLTLRQG